MKIITYYSTNNKSEKVNFETALMNGLASNYGLYMLDRAEIPIIDSSRIREMGSMNYHEIAFDILYPYLHGNIDKEDLRKLLEECYNEKIISTNIQLITGRTYIIWLTNGPTYSFKDYAARFFGRILNHFLERSSSFRLVIVATSGDTGGAVADALFRLKSIECIVFFPKGSITARQRRQISTLKNNIYAVEVNGDFDICQGIAKRLLGDHSYSRELFGKNDAFTSANSISIGRLLPQAVYPFFAYSRVAEYPEPIIFSVPSGNFGDLTGTVISKFMGLPVRKLLCGVNENKVFPDFMKTTKYTVKPSIMCPSSAMVVSNPSNFDRLINLYGGHVYDKRDEGGKVIRKGIIDVYPNMKQLKNDIHTDSVSNRETYRVIKEVYDQFKQMIEPHGAVAWKVLDGYLNGKHDKLSVVYETADPGKFPDDIKKAIKMRPNVPIRIEKQSKMQETIYRIKEMPDRREDGSLEVSDRQYEEVKNLMKDIFNKK